MENTGLRVGPCPTAGALGLLKQTFQGRRTTVESMECLVRVFRCVVRSVEEMRTLLDNGMTRPPSGHMNLPYGVNQVPRFLLPIRPRLDAIMPDATQVMKLAGIREGRCQLARIRVSSGRHPIHT